MIFAVMLYWIAPQDFRGEPNPPVDPMIARIEAAAPRTDGDRDAERRARIVRLRQVRNANGATTGRTPVARDRRQRADAALIAAEDLNDLLIREGRLTPKEPYGDAERLAPASISPNFALRHTWICRHALSMDDPVKAMIDEGQRAMIQDRYALTMLCKVYWEAYAASAE